MKVEWLFQIVALVIVGGAVYLLIHLDVIGWDTPVGPLPLIAAFFVYIGVMWVVGTVAEKIEAKKKRVESDQDPGTRK